MLCSNNTYFILPWATSLEADWLHKALSTALAEGKARYVLMLQNKQLKSAPHFERLAQVSKF